MKIESRDVRDTTKTLEPLLELGEEYFVYMGCGSRKIHTVTRLGSNDILPVFLATELTMRDMINVMKRNEADITRLYFTVRNKIRYCCCIGVKGEKYV